MVLHSWKIGKGKEWIDITDPQSDELDDIAAKYKINRHIVRDCLDPDHLPKHESVGDYTFIIIRLAKGNIKAHLDSLSELTTKIAIFYNHHFLITIHRMEQDFMKDLFGGEINKNEEVHVENLVTSIVRYALRSFEQPVTVLSEQIENYEATVLLKHTRPALLQGLYYIKRKSATYKKVLLLSDDLINFLNTTASDKSSVQDVRDLYTMLITLCDQALEDVTNLLNIYLSLATQKTNEIMKVLTIISVFFMPLTFISGIYGMNFRYMPELTMRYAYPTVWIVMLVMSLLIYIWMKKKRWL